MYYPRCLLITTVTLVAILVTTSHARRPRPGDGGRDAADTADQACHLCVRGKPKPDCCWFFLLESGVGIPLSMSAARDPGAPMAVFGDLGFMANAGRRHALGASIHFSGDDSGARWCFVPRYRLWLNPDVALDLKLGVMIGAAEDHGDVSNPAYIAGLSVAFRELFGFDLWWERYDYDWTVKRYPDPPAAHSATISSVYASLSGRSWAGLALAPVVFVVYALMNIELEVI